MTLAEVQAFAFAVKGGTKSAEEIKTFSLALLADSDAIVRYDWLKENLDSTPKDVRKAIYKRLDAELQKYPGMYAHEDPLFGKPGLALRSKIGLFRGVKWDRHGALRLTDEVRQANIELGKIKLVEMLGADADLTQVHGTKAEAIKKTIQEHQDVLAGKVKTRGSIWDFIASDARSAADLPPVKEEG